MKFSFVLLLTLLMFGFSLIYSPLMLDKIPFVGTLVHEFTSIGKSLMWWWKTNLLLAVCFALAVLFYLIRRKNLAIIFQKFILLVMIMVHLVPFFFWFSASIFSLDAAVLAAAHLLFAGFMLYAVFSSRALGSSSGRSM
ncbi:hypothetical protein [Paenibacillus sp. UNC499MF]|uniref:hypothetical protein n=1 Tax=Paenibacillus sp. UNC499MF TaxID=1502751 RepID=UPI0008A07A19|nr:hypothetical protein [Paenibacillus sp. UNC499MF]SEG75855.1 hypothetical protein SAMN02799616_04864 [Paenibacillus sp. UNC499MF]